jgi:hypothetical protein
MNTEQLTLWIAVAALVAQIIQTYVAVRTHRQQPGAAIRKPKAEAPATGLPRNVMFRLIGLAAVGWAAVLFGYFSQHKGSLLDTFLSEMAGRPLGWSGPYISGTSEGAFIREDKLNISPNIRAISFSGHNFGIEEVVIEAAYLISGINGKRLDLNVSWGGQRFAPKDLNPIPPSATIFLTTEHLGSAADGLAPNDFLKDWATFSLVVEYDGKKHRMAFDQNQVAQRLPKPIAPFPHVTPREK